jgi:hypothetical protein
MKAVGTSDVDRAGSTIAKSLNHSSCTVLRRITDVTHHRRPVVTTRHVPPVTVAMTTAGATTVAATTVAPRTDPTTIATTNVQAASIEL